MINAAGIPFFSPLFGVGGMPFPWAVHPPPPQGSTGSIGCSSSPPGSPSSSPVSSTWHRPQPSRAAAFTIDAILGRSASVEKGHLGASKGRREDRLARTAPYPHLSCDESSNLRSSASVSPGSSSASPSVSGGAGGKSKCKRVRTIFTAEQLERLEAEFARQQYMVGPERLYLAAALNLTEAQVKVWFQNRRIKWRKQYIEQQHAKLSSRHSDDDTEKDLSYKDEDEMAKDLSRQTPSVLSLEDDLSVAMSHSAATTSSDLHRFQEEDKSEEDDDEEEPRKPSSEVDVQPSISLIHKPLPSVSTSASSSAPNPITTAMCSSRPYQVYLAAATLSPAAMPIKAPSSSSSSTSSSSSSSSSSPATFQKTQTEPTDLSNGIHSS